MDEKDHLLIIGSCAVIILSVFALFLMGVFGSNTLLGAAKTDPELSSLIDKIRLIGDDDYTNSYKYMLKSELLNGYNGMFLDNLKNHCQQASESANYLVDLHQKVASKVKSHELELGPVATESALIWDCY